MRHLSTRMSRRARIVIAAPAALLLGLSGGAAYAYFTSAGAGSGSASVGTPSPVTVVNATGTVTNLLYPNSSGDLLIDLTNPNSYAVSITSLAANGASTPSGDSDRVLAAPSKRPP